MHIYIFKTFKNESTSVNKLLWRNLYLHAFLYLLNNLANIACYTRVFIFKILYLYYSYVKSQCE